MKRFISLFLAVICLFSSCILLSSCFHTCEFSEEWYSDAASHWHACTGKDCTEIADKADHSWNDGEITTKPTQEAGGVKTYTCTVCAATRKELVEFTGLTEEEWNAVFSADTFNNFTYNEVTIGKSNGVQVEVTISYFFADNSAKISMKMLGETQEQTVTGVQLAEVRKSFVDSLDPMFGYEDYEYDKETKTYRLVGTIEINSMGTDVTLDTATLRFENGKPVEFIYSGEGTSNGVSVEVSATATFSDYGTTVLP